MKRKVLLLLLLVIPLVAKEQEKGPNLLQVLQQGGEFNTLIAAFQEAELVPLLSELGPYTLFAPTDRAFTLLFPGTLQELMVPEGRLKLRTLLRYHLVRGELTPDQIRRAGVLNTLAGEPLVVNPSWGQIEIENATLGEAMKGTNGVVYPIDRVLQPTEGASYGG
ncbi:MAG: fasciclin domain-containing protein [Parachlamydiales bacterium]